MGPVILRRVLVMPLLLLAASFVIFSALYLTPGSPEQALLGGKHVDEKTLEEVRERYDLNAPFIVQYGNWLKRAVTGDFGESISHQSSVSSVIGPEIPVTLELTAFAAVLIILGGVFLGVVAAMNRGRALDFFTSSTALTFSAIPSFILALLLISVFAISLGWFPVIGAGEGGFERFHHLVLPAIALAAVSVAMVTRTTRAAMIGALGQDFTETAASRGLSRRKIVGKHALRHALIPVVTISGLITGYLLSGAVIIEYAFGLNGLGSQLVHAVNQKDFALVQAIALFMVLAFLVINLVVDLLYAWIDPRVRLRAVTS